MEVGKGLPTCIVTGQCKHQKWLLALKIAYVDDLIGAHAAGRLHLGNIA